MEVPTGPVTNTTKRLLELATSTSESFLVRPGIIGELPVERLRSNWPGAAVCRVVLRATPITRFPLTDVRPAVSRPMNTRLPPFATIRPCARGAALLDIGSHESPSSDTHTNSATGGAAVGLAGAGVSFAEADAAAEPDAPADAGADADADALAEAEEPAEPDGRTEPDAAGDGVGVGVSVGVGVGVGVGDAVGVGELADFGSGRTAGAPYARKLPLAATTPSRDTVRSSVGAVDFVQVPPSDDDQDAARPGALAPVSVPARTTRLPIPAIPRTSKPSSEVGACSQLLPLGENQTAEPGLRVGPVPFQRPTITKPPFQDPTDLSVYEPAPGRSFCDQVSPSVLSQARPFPAATMLPERVATPPTISWPLPLSTGMLFHDAPSRECHALAATSVEPDPKLLPTTTRPPLPSSEIPWGTKRRPPTSKEPDCERWDQVSPSRDAQTVVVAVLLPSFVSTTDPTMIVSVPYVVKNGPKSSLGVGILPAPCQVTP